MNRRSFFRLLGLAPMIPLVKKLPAPARTLEVHTDCHEGNWWDVPLRPGMVQIATTTGTEWVSCPGFNPVDYSGEIIWHDSTGKPLFQEP